jgi:hypothetical protein
VLHDYLDDPESEFVDFAYYGKITHAGLSRAHATLKSPTSSQ